MVLDDTSLLLLEAGCSWAALLLMTNWVAMLRSSSVVFLKMSTDAWKGYNSGTSRTPLLGTSATGTLGSWLGFLRPSGSP
jgi:hypothetical protein